MGLSSAVTIRLLIRSQCSIAGGGKRRILLLGSQRPHMAGQATSCRTFSLAIRSHQADRCHGTASLVGVGGDPQEVAVVSVQHAVGRSMLRATVCIASRIDSQANMLARQVHVFRDDVETRAENDGMQPTKQNGAHNKLSALSRRLVLAQHAQK